MLGVILGGIFKLLPDYESLPLPDWFYTNIAIVFAKLKLLFELPILRTLAEYFWIWWPIWLLLQSWNVVVKILSLFWPPLIRLQVKEHQNLNEK